MSGVKGNSIRVRAFQHTPSEPLGYFEQIFSEEGIPFDYTQLWEDDPVSARNATHLIFLVGPMSANDEKELPWLKEEKKLIRLAVRKQVPVLGLCLGALLIASAQESLHHSRRLFTFSRCMARHSTSLVAGDSGAEAIDTAPGIPARVSTRSPVPP
jgi:hypothetical protein